VSFIDASGTEWMLNGETNYVLLPGRKGWYSTPVVLDEQPVPGQDGARLKNLYLNTRELDLPLMISAYDIVSQRAAVRALVSALNPKLGDARVRSYAPDSTVRELYGRLVDGLGFDENDQVAGLGWMDGVLVFRSVDPFWYDQNDTTLLFGQAAPTSFFSFRLGSFLTSSGILSSFSILNDGDVDAWPVWTLTGPMTNPVFTDTTTGYALTMTIVLTAGQVLTIDTRPGFKTVKREDGSNQFAILSSASVLWPLARGNNVITLVATATTTASKVQVSYKRKWLAP
jgi:hypothetical protein